MNVVDTLGMVGEILSWIGLGIGLPLLLIAMLVRSGDGRWLPVEVVIVTDSERILSAQEYRGPEAKKNPRPGFVSEKRPSKMRFEPRRPVIHEFYVIGLTLTIIGALILLLSFLPMVVG